MTMRTRLQRLEAKARRSSASAEDYWDDLDDDAWLECFAEWGRQGHFATEPDFEAALDFYHDALQRAKMRSDPPFDPPPDFMPNLSDLPHLRVLNWRTAARFPDVHAGCNWLLEMLRRLHEGIPPVSVAEFAELAEWFQANEARLYRLSAPSYVLDVGEGRTVALTNLRYGLHQGVRAWGAGELAEELRQVQRRYGGDGT